MMLHEAWWPQVPSRLSRALSVVPIIRVRRVSAQLVMCQVRTAQNFICGNYGDGKPQSKSSASCKHPN
jgi:hypothetical protein